MHNYFLTFILTGILLSTSGAYASDRVTLEQLFTDPDPVKTLEVLKINNPANVQDLCVQIKDLSFYEKAETAKIGVLKRNKIMQFCDGVKFEVGTFKKAIQKEKPAEAPKETVVLKPVDLGKKGASVQEEQVALEAARKEIVANAKLLEQRPEMIKIQEKIAVATKQLEAAKEYYDNLTVAISILREDLKGISGFKVFKPQEHEKDTPEQYLLALNQALPQESPHLLHPDSLAQIRAASDLLRQANENLARTRVDLEAINREMLLLTQ